MNDLWNRFIEKLKGEPAVLTQIIQALIGAAVAFDLVAFSEGQTGAILAVTTAFTSLLLAVAVQPFKWITLTGLGQAVLVLLTEFGLSWTDAQVAGAYSVISILVMGIRWLVTPEVKLPAHTPVTS